MALAISTITASIADIEVDGVTIKDKSELKTGWDAYDCPLFCPRPNEFVSAPQVVAENFGTGTTRKLSVFYSLAYRYFHAPIGSGDLEDTWSDMVDNIFLILDAILVNDAITGVVDLSVQAITEFGAVQDGANNLFHGCDVILRVQEFVN
jgi:hypothetical protein